jgi:hypothetical protein
MVITPSIPSAPPQLGRRSQPIKAVFYRGEGSNVQGGTGPVTVSVDDNPDRIPSVGVSESFLDGVGNSCKASAWMAAIASSQAMGRLMTRYKFDVEVGGHVDGPSMGLLLTATMMALINGDKIDPTATMTGAVNPDGTAAPVGGIPHKLEGAHKAGMKKFGYPAGCSTTDMRTDKSVDVIAWGKERGIEVRTLSNCQDAYELLTGKTLPTRAPVALSALELSADAALRMRGQRENIEPDQEKSLAEAREKLGRLNTSALSRLLGTNPTARALSASLDADLEVGKRHAKLAREAADIRSEAKAFFHTRIADECFTAAAVQADLLGSLLQGDAAMRDWLQRYEQTRASTEKKLEALKNSLGGHTRMTRLGGKVDSLLSYLHYGEAVVARYWSDLEHVRYRLLVEHCVDLEKKLAGKSRPTGVTRTELQNSYQVAISELMYLIWNVIRHLSIAQRKAQTTGAWVQFARNDAGPEVVERPEVYGELGRAYSAAATAAQAYFEALVFGDVKTTDGKRRRQVFVQQEAGYPFVSAATLFSAREPDGVSPNAAPRDPLERFTTALYGYTGSSAYMMNYYTFSGAVVTPGTFSGASFKNPEMLAKILDAAQERVLRECAELQAEHGFIPDAIKYNFDLASKLRYMGDGERLIALKAYWRCNVLCYLTRLLGKP